MSSAFQISLISFSFSRGFKMYFFLEVKTCYELAYFLKCLEIHLTVDLTFLADFRKEF